LLTSFYSWRLMFLTFFGQPRWALSEHIRHAMHADHDSDHRHVHHADAGTAGYRPHESPLAMLIPLGLLSVGAVLAGYLFTHEFISAGSGEFWRDSVAFSEALIHHMHGVPLWVKWAPFAVMALGLGGAVYAYLLNPGFPVRFAAAIRPVYLLFYNKWYFDELYHVLLVRPAFWLGDKFWRLGDQGLIDRFGPNGSAWAVLQGSRLAGRMQTGLVYSYALVMLLGLTAALSWVMSH